MPIPKIILQTSKNKPEQYVVDKILSKCPHWKYVHYNDEEVIRFFTENYLEEFKEIIIKFNEMPTGAHKADLFRYYYLYINGGVFIDSDAMIELNIENIIKDYDFFSVESTFIRNSIFQGFIGSTPKNIIIYEALKDAYNIDKLYLKNVYHALCYNLTNIIKNNQSNVNYYLYKERRYNDDCAECYNNDNETILLHYWRYKIIPV
jgi:mannosyltransferase OCH1-like enzyme